MATINVWARLQEALDQEVCSLIVLSRPRDKQQAETSKISIRPVQLKEGLQYQFVRRVGGQEFHENRDRAETVKEIETLFPETYGDLHLYTTNFDLTARVQKGNKLRVKQKSPSHAPEEVTEHNRSKQYLIPEGVPCPFLHEIGVMTPEGKVRASRYHKFRQINRFLELVNDVVPSLPSQGLLNIVDFGCGKSYLTFALHHLLTNIQRREVNIVGLDRRDDVIQTCKHVASELDCDGLAFQKGDIQHYEPGTKIDMAVSLHACDTATDEVLAQAIAWDAEVILAVPCCQHEVAGLLPKEVQRPLTQHGILKERYAALVTDALRAKMLEAAGYQVQIVEFIDMEHTAKNLLIRAVKIERKPQVLKRRREEYQRYREELGLPELALERLLKATKFDA
ncbi:MAG: SAM-dependent methyltransferase [Planctomyces sp.]|nr:SAM-dependent methyltransferase [Planctomyces sp.]